MSGNLEMEFMRSPLLMNRHDTVLLIVDIQEKLLPHIQNHERLLWNVRRLIDGANALGVSVAISEQYPKGLGPTVEAILEKLTGKLDNSRFDKTMFSCRECEEMINQFHNSQIRNVVVTGIETHVCVMQTGLDLLAAGLEVYVCNDAVGSRFENDYVTAPVSYTHLTLPTICSV